MRNVGELEEVKDRGERLSLREEEERREMARMLDNPAFRNFVWRLLIKSRMFDSISHGDPIAMAVASGKRDIGLVILAEALEAKPEIYPVMMRENQDRERKYDGPSD